MPTYTAGQLRGMKPAELRQVAAGLGLEVTGYQTLEDFVRAVLDTQAVVLETPAWLREEPDWLREPAQAATRQLGGQGFPQNLLGFVSRLNELFAENQFAWEAVQTLLNSRYTTDREVNRIVDQRLEAFRLEMNEALGPAIDRLSTSHKEADEPDIVRKALKWLGQNV